jgi:sugar phosphate permease
MKTIFNLINFFISVFCLLIGVGNIEFATHNPAGAIAGFGIALVVGVACFWLAVQSVLDGPQQAA